MGEATNQHLAAEGSKDISIIFHLIIIITIVIIIKMKNSPLGTKMNEEFILPTTTACVAKAKPYSHRPPLLSWTVHVWLDQIALVQQLLYE